MAEAQRCAERVTWPDALAELALSKAELARWAGNSGEAYRQLDIATTILGEEAAKRPNIRAVTHDLLGYLADDLDEARTYHAAACQAASEAGHAPGIARVLVGVADLALRFDQHEQAARLLAASAGVRGLPDRAHPGGGPNRAGHATSPRRRTVRRGSAGRHADHLVSAGRGHTLFLKGLPERASWRAS